MRELFLGKPVHWGLLACAVALLWWAGLQRLHVIHFNWFLAALCIGSAESMVFILKTTGEDEQVTRDPLEDSDDEDEEAVQSD